MDVWKARLENARATFLEDDDEDELSIALTLEHLEDAIQGESPPRGVLARGSHVGKKKNIERARMDKDAS